MGRGRREVLQGCFAEAEGERAQGPGRRRSSAAAKRARWVPRASDGPTDAGHVVLLRCLSRLAERAMPRAKSYPWITRASRAVTQWYFYCY